MSELSFTLNGESTTVEYPEGMNLLDVLRDVCGLTSPKDGCSPQGYCGCCTVLIDGRGVPSCLRKPEQVAGREVTTLEGLTEEERQALMESFGREGAVQCGFCIPGIVVRSAGLIRGGKAGDRDAIARGLSGNLCRCTGYSRILDAVESAGEALSGNGNGNGQCGPRRPDFFGDGRECPAGEGIGSLAPRYRGSDHALGEKDYVADMSFEGMLHGAPLLAAHPRAKVVAVDTTKALAQDGVLRILTADDVPGQRRVGLIVRDWPVFIAVGETTNCAGDVLALVVADTMRNARQAAAAVEVTYDVYEPVTDSLAALEEGSPSVHPSGNLLDTCKIHRGDADAALIEAAHIVEETFTTQRIEHAFLEPEACLALPHPERDGHLKVYSQGQGVHDDQRQIAEVLAMDAVQVDVELVTNGGAFGGKEDLSVQAQTALAARLIGRPVKTVLSREQSILMHPKRHPIVMIYSVGADKEGHLTAVRARMVGDTGAYASVGMKVLERAAGHSCGPYRVPHVDVEARSVYTNNPPCGAMRGFGANQAGFAIESIMDIIAEKVGVDGYDIRERNILATGDAFATGQLMTKSCGIRQTLEAVKDVYKANVSRAGIGCGIKNTGIGNGMDDSGRLLLRILEGGRIEILTGYTEMGQGLFTILRQVVAEETGLAVALMSVRTASDAAVLCGMTTASRATALLTAAGHRAALELAKDLKENSLADLAGREYLGEYICDFTTKPGTEKEGVAPMTHVTFSYATQVVLMGEDGRIERVVAAHDVGRAIHPLQCAGQIEGSVHMGLGYALSEDLPCTDGRPDSTLLRDLGILKAKDTPIIDVILVEVPDEVGGYGSKGVGEIGLVPTAGAVAGALYTHDGVRRKSLPMIDAPAARASVPKARRSVTTGA
jgi:selenium-dependent xanthine dehydrogenase